jgi:F0F1-type ATP synthase assembly protein I
MSLDHAWAVIAHATCAVLATTIAGGLAYMLPAAMLFTAQNQGQTVAQQAAVVRGSRTAAILTFLVIALAIWWGKW